MQEVPYHLVKEIGWSGNLTGFQMGFDGITKMIYGLCITVVYSWYVVKDMVQVQKIWIKLYWNNEKNPFWYCLKEDLMWFHFNLNEFISGKWFLMWTERSDQKEVSHRYENEQKAS